MDEIDKIQREKTPMDFDKKYIQHFQLYSALRDTLVRAKASDIRVFLIQRAFCELIQAILVSRDNQMKRRLEGIIFESQDFYDIIKELLSDVTQKDLIFNKQFETLLESIYIPPMNFNPVQIDPQGHMAGFKDFYEKVKNLILSFESVPETYEILGSFPNYYNIILDQNEMIE